MRSYEELFIVKPDATEEEIDALNQQLEAVITQADGKLEKTEKWGVRKLAYRVDKNNEGYYVLMFFHAGPQVVRELERRLRVSDLVIKYITVRMDEKLKWLEKRKKAREKRAARRPPPPPPASAPLGPAPGAPGEAHPAPGAPAADQPAAAEPVAAAVTESE